MDVRTKREKSSRFNRHRERKRGNMNQKDCPRNVLRIEKLSKTIKMENFAHDEKASHSEVSQLNPLC